MSDVPPPGPERAAPDPAAPDPAAPDPAAPDVAALRRRVLLTGLVSLVLFLVLAYLVASAGLSDWWLLPAIAVGYVVVVRPLMRPVRAATKLRRGLAYQAYLEGKDRQR